MEHPFLATDFHIRWSTLSPGAIEADLTLALQRTAEAVDAITANERDRSYAATFGALDEALEPLSLAWGKVGHLDSVSNSDALRKAYNTMLPRVTAFYSGIPLNDALWSTLEAAEKALADSDLSPVQRRHIDETIADFRKQGAGLPEAKKERVRAIHGRLAECTQKYSENVLDATNAWSVAIDDPDRLAGLPDSARKAALASAKSKGLGDADRPVWRFTLQAPSLIPVLTYAEDEVLRREVWSAYNALCNGSDQDNRALTEEILKLRQELATLIGTPDFAELVLERRMARSGNAALRFVEDLHRDIAARFEDEVVQLRRFKANACNQPVEPLEPWESAFWAERQRLECYQFDEEALRPYFPINRVIAGLFEITERVFGLRIVERPTVFHEPGKPDRADAEAVEVWHPEVRFYELFDASNDLHLGSFYTDWHPRESKRGGAWMNYLITGGPRPDGSRAPHLGMICGNMTPGLDGQPALLTHREVETVFHEFGHLLHHLCGEVEVKSLNGVNVAWDFVELPSQMMENWCWERTSLDLFARHFESGEPIPEALFDKMMAARNYMSASANMRQLSLAILDLSLHIQWAPDPSVPLDEFVDSTLRSYLPEYKTKPQPYTYHFSHLFAHPVGYAAGYYSYKWSEVLDADAFTRFQLDDILSPEVGRAFRSTILARGNAEDPAKLFRDFMGRDPDATAMLRRDGLLRDDHVAALK